MWPTLDGNQLLLHRDVAPSITAEPDRWEIRDLLRMNYGGDVRSAVNKVFHKLAAAATRAGQFRGPSTDRVYPVFHTRADGRTYQIVTQAGGGPRHWIVGVRIGPLEDLADFYVAQYKGKAKVQWSGPFSAAGWNPASFSHGGVYLIERLDGST